jgi:exonuclease I
MESKHIKRIIENSTNLIENNKKLANNNREFIEANIKLIETNSRAIDQLEKHRELIYNTRDICRQIYQGLTDKKDKTIIEQVWYLKLQSLFND